MLIQRHGEIFFSNFFKKIYKKKLIIKIFCKSSVLPHWRNSCPFLPFGSWSKSWLRRPTNIVRWGPTAKVGKMAWDEPPRPGVEMYHEIQNACWSTTDHVHHETHEKVLLAWNYVVSIEDVLRPSQKPWINRDRCCEGRSNEISSQSFFLQNPPF